MREATVVTGPRSGIDRQSTAPFPNPEDIVRANVARAASQARPERTEEGEVLFVSEHARYRIQLAALPDRMDPATGALIRGKSIYALFNGGEYRTKDAQIIEWMLASKSYGRHYWKASDIDTANANASEDRIVAALASNPSLAEKVIERLTRAEKDDQVFTLPSQKANAVAGSTPSGAPDKKE